MTINNTDIRELHDRIDALEKELDRSNSRVEELEKKLAEATATIDGYRNRFNSMMQPHKPQPRSAYPKSARVHGDYDDYSDHVPYPDDDR